jgi:MazG family protein
VGTGSKPPGDRDATIEALEQLDRITRRLRRECPWDREQDERSIVPHTVEEAYELADAASAGDDEKLLDELGDVLFQVYFLALLLEERGAGDLAAVARLMREKLIRRHPHVFGEAEVADAAEVLDNWDRIKREQEGRAELFGDVPENLPALLHARKLQRRVVSRGGADVEAGIVAAPGHEETVESIRRTLSELESLAAAGASGAPAAEPVDRDRAEAELGELLFAVVDLARRLRIDPELSLRSAATRFRQRAEDS